MPLVTFRYVFMNIVFSNYVLLNLYNVQNDFIHLFNGFVDKKQVNIYKFQQTKVYNLYQEHKNCHKADQILALLQIRMLRVYSYKYCSCAANLDAFKFRSNF
jgi:arginine deiminase